LNVVYLADKESVEATQELEEISGFAESFARGKKEIAEGRIKPLEKLKRKFFVNQLKYSKYF
jgi:hypothetical protein